MFTYSVTVGRNFGTSARPELQGTPMSDQLWAELVEAVRTDLVRERGTLVDVIEVSYGEGVWLTDREQNATVTLRTHYRLGVNAEQRVRESLADIASVYAQDAIALSVGVSELIAPRVPASA